MSKLIRVGVLVVFIGFLVVMAFLLHPFGVPPSAMDDYIIENSQKQAGANEVVTAIIFDWRGYDTLGEAIILTAAVSGVVMVLRKERE